MSTDKLVAGILVGSMVPPIQESQHSTRPPIVLSERSLDLEAVIGEVAGMLYLTAQKAVRERYFSDGETKSPAARNEARLSELGDQAVIAALITGGMLPFFRPPPRQRALTGYTEKDLQPATDLLEDALALYDMIYGTLRNNPIFNTATGVPLAVIRNQP